MKQNPISPAASAPAPRAGMPPGLAGRALQVRSNLRAGQWQCRSCQGEVNGDRMNNPFCSYCRFV